MRSIGYLIETHWQDMMQVVSLHPGRTGHTLDAAAKARLATTVKQPPVPSAFRELGRVERTLFLLRFYLQHPQTRRTIRAETTKIESLQRFPRLDLVRRRRSIKSADPVEQEKQLKYASLIANAVMLSNVDDLTRVLSDMAADGHPVTPALVASLSPYMRRHILRFGRYALDMDNLPEPLNPQPLPFEHAL